ncbi:MAG: ABC transporter substrate-binding protein [Chloroflexi bacterium]|nr:ABC transporter substrate-binding protein [Chloroflexota bacterium]
MFSKLKRRVGLVLLAVVVVVLPALVGCGGNGGETARPELIMGSLLDLTGPANSSILPVVAGVQDYLKWLEKNDPLPVKLTWKMYDTKTDYSRVTVGYEWLKGQGTDFFWTLSAIDAEMIKDKFGADKLPTFLLTTTSVLKTADYVYPVAYGYPAEGALIFDYIVNHWWDYTKMGRNPRVGIVGVSFVNAVQTRDSFEVGVANNPGKMDLVEVPLAPVATASWAAEYAKAKDCDIVVALTFTTSTASLTTEFRSRGYKGAFLGNSLTLMSSWNVVRDRVSKQDLDGFMGPQMGPMWTDASAYLEVEKQVEAAYKSDIPAATFRTHWESGNWMSGGLYAQMIVDCIRRAAAKVGAENVNGEAMNDAFATLNMDLGWGERLQWYPERVYHRMARIVKYDAATDSILTVLPWTNLPSWAPV